MAREPAAAVGIAHVLAPQVEPDGLLPEHEEEGGDDCAPTQTSRQATSTSGMTLNMAPKRAAMSASESPVLTSQRSGAVHPGSMAATRAPIATRAVLRSRETRRRKPTTRTMPKEKSRFARKLRSVPRCGSRSDRPDVVEGALQGGKGGGGTEDERQEAEDGDPGRAGLLGGDVVDDGDHLLRAGGAHHLAQLHDELALHLLRIGQQAEEREQHQEQRGE
jgi:hypothetical protein